MILCGIAKPLTGKRRKQLARALAICFRSHTGVPDRGLAYVIALALVGSLLPGRFHHFEHFFRWTGFLLWSRFLRHTQVSHRPNHFAISGFQTHNQTAHSTKIEGATGFWRTIPVSACRAVCFIRAKKVRPANWYGSKGRVSEGGAALNALGSLAFLARPVVNH